MKNCPTCQASYPNNFVVCPQDGDSLIEVGAWSEGAVIRGKYRILSKVGQGGMGTVYKVVHVAFEEVHALKVIIPSLMSDELFVKRFKHEAVITRKLQHPNAVRVDDIDEAEDGRPIIVMEYIEGQSLKKLIQDQGALPVPRVCSIIKQAAAALDAAHALGMVHRDIKPDNIVLISTPEGEVAKVLDFGIAKIKEAHASDSGGLTLTGTGVVIGTPQYMSPEQAMGKRGDDLDGRSDLYSLGVVMYQMLTGDLPFKADTTMAMLLAHMQTDPISIRGIHPELQIPDAIANVVMKTLEKDPDRRPRTARELITEIENAEKWTPPLSETRVFEPSRDYSPQDSARRLRESLQAPPPRSSGTRRVTQNEYHAPTPEPEVSPPIPPPEPKPQRPPVRVEPPQPPRQVVAPAPPRKSAAGLWAVVGILAILLVAGGGYVFLKNSSPPQGVTQDDKKTNPNDTKDGSQAGQGGTQSGTGTEGSKPIEKQPAQQDNSGTQQTTTDNNEPRSAKKQSSTGTERPPKDQNIPRREVQRREAEVPSRQAVDPAKVAGSIKLGDFYLARGEYDNAINEFEKGLSLDPTNATLRSKLDRARKAKAAEGRVLQ